MKDKYSKIFPYSEFFERFVCQYEEFRFFYNGKTIDISYCSENSAALAYGNEEAGYLWKDYSSPQQFLQDPIFEGKTIKEIWDELE